MKVPPALKLMVPPERLTVVEPAVAPERVPPQVLVVVVSAIANPDGKLSVKAKPFSAFAVLGLVIVKVSVAVVGLKVNTGI